jgi:CO/xanthine dehydrogenase FAD-binding subunit
MQGEATTLGAVDVLTPRTLDEALRLKAERPEAVPIQGGTDVMVELNFDRGRPPALLNLKEVEELRGWSRENGQVWLGAGLTYTEAMEQPLAELLPALAEAARTVGGPQIRNRGTVGGNLGTASPAGDALPPLLVCDATVKVASVHGERTIALAEFLVGPKRNALAEDELILGVSVPADPVAQTFMKVGPRNAMVIAVCSLAVDVSPGRRTVAACLGSAGPTPIRASDAEAFIGGVLEDLWESRDPIPDAALARFGELVELAARPINDVRGTAGYRRHAVGVMARRTLNWAWSEPA